MLLTMSDVERGIYDNCHSSLEKRQMCCHLQVVERLHKVIGSDMMTLNQVKDVMISHTNQVPRHRLLWLTDPLTPTVVIWVQLQSILCQTGLSRHCNF